MSRRDVWLLLVLLVQPCITPIFSNSENQAPVLLTTVVIPSEYYTDHSPIRIDSNQDFQQYASSGTGTEQDPYIIEGLSIVSTGTQNSSISVTYTSVYFFIRNCYLETGWAGIEILQIAAGTGRIVNNTCISNSGDGAGIVVWGSQNVTIAENRCSNLSQGIHLNEAGRCFIDSNNISDNNYQGINIRYSHLNIITNNMISNTAQHGLAFVGTSNFNLAHHNHFIGNGREDTYRIDGEPRGDLTSQGFDEGNNNTWYDAVAEEGNWWSDYSGTGSYSIDGPSDSVDLYPNPSQDQQQVPGYEMLQLVVVITLFGVAIVLFVWRISKSRYT